MGPLLGQVLSVILLQSSFKVLPVNETTTSAKCAHKSGNFPDLSDSSCTKYYVCLANGTNFYEVAAECPQGTYFSPEMQWCTVNYQCPNKLRQANPNSISDEALQLGKECQIGGVFSCTEEGQFRDLNDLSCNKYFTCDQLKNASFVQTKHTCPNGSVFDQDNKMCSTVYKCPCSTKPSSTTVKSKLGNPCKANGEPDFVCTKKGRFRKPNDESCMQYYLCSPLRNGTILRTEYSCLPASYFDQSISLCSQDYICPYNNESSITTETTSTTIPTTTSESSCINNENPNFVCTSKGRFRKPNDLTCSKYYTCVQLKNRTFVEYEYSCPSGTYFDQFIGQCSADFTCPCMSTSLSISTTTTSTTILTTVSEDSCVDNEDSIFGCTSKGRFKKPNDLTCTTYYTCVQLKNGTFVKYEYSCPSGTYFDQSIGQCSADFTCPCLSTSLSISSTTTSTTNPTTTSENSCINNENSNFFCTSKGRFKKPNDLTCTKYYTCVQLKNGTFVNYEYSCPSGTYFDQSIDQCSADFTCPCLSTSLSISSTTTSTTNPTTTSENSCVNNENSIFFCTSKGRFKKPNDLTCTKYSTCVQLKNGTFVNYEYSCPSGTYFDQSIDQCSADFTCPCLSTSLSISSTTTSTTIPTTTSENSCVDNEDSNFGCTSKGRFKKPNDLTCSKYYTCVQLKNGTFVKYEYSCPSGTYFDQSIDQCSTDYVCLCLPTSTTSLSVSTTSTTPGSTACQNIIDENPDFVCNMKGRFRKPNDVSCTKYYLCSQLRNGTILRTEYLCPFTSYFDESIGICSREFMCPCNNESQATTLPDRLL